ncbi:hypothetical protein GPALN_013027 [Globodera pallida]|nr:hypothetical protein GPALN_013027 [Globodera pallida]
MVPQNSEFTRKLRAAVRAKIEEFGIDVDDELPDYVMIMVGNKKDKMRMKTDLRLFLGDKTPDFVEWLFGFFQKVKNATALSSTSSAQQLQNSAEILTDKEKKRATAERTASKGNGEGKAAEKVSSLAEKPMKRGGRTKELAKSMDKTNANGPSSADSSTSLSRERGVPRHPPQQKGRQPSSNHHSAVPKSRALSRSRSPPRHDRGGGGGTKRTPPRRTRPSPKGHSGDHSISPDRKPVVLPSKGPPALRSVVSVPVQFTPTCPSSRPCHRPFPVPNLGSSPKVLLSGGVVPVETAVTTTNYAKVIVNQLDIAVATAKGVDRRRPMLEEQPTNETDVVIPRKQKFIRTIHALSPHPKATLAENTQQKEQSSNVVLAKPPRRRVVFGGGSLIFQRAIQQQTTTANSATSPPKEQQKATVVVRPQVRVLSVPFSGTPESAEGDGLMAVEAQPTAKRPPQRLTLIATQQQTGASIFQRAIKETKRQRTAAEDGEGAERRPKRVSAEGVESNNENGGDEHAEIGVRKRLRLEVDQQPQLRVEAPKHVHVENEEDRTEEVREQKQQQEDEEVLTIDMSRTIRRKREIRRPRIGLELVKEHITGAHVAKDRAEKEKEQERVQEQEQSPNPANEHQKDETEKVESTEEKEDEAGRGSRVSPERTFHLNRNWASNASAMTTTSAPIWDGRIEIDDMSSTDDEAEIDAVLEDAQRLRKIALERELPPTAALSRPLLYNPLEFSISTETGLISPSDAALLPAVTYKQRQLVMLSGSSSTEQQQLNSNGVTSPTVDGITAAATACASSAAVAQQQRPHATVAPTTTIQAAPATMIVHQQYHYHHQQQQLNQFSHPYSPGYVPSAAMAYHQGGAYRYQLNRGSMSKVYTGRNKTQFATHQQNVSIEGKESLKQQVHALREQHKQKSLSLQHQLEEQRLLLGQLQKMAPTAELGHRKEMLLRVRQMDALIGQLKSELNDICEHISSATKSGGGAT